MQRREEPWTAGDVVRLVFLLLVAGVLSYGGCVVAPEKAGCGTQSNSVE